MKVAEGLFLAGMLLGIITGACWIVNSVIVALDVPISSYAWAAVPTFILMSVSGWLWMDYTKEEERRTQNAICEAYVQQVIGLNTALLANHLGNEEVVLVAVLNDHPTHHLSGNHLGLTRRVASRLTERGINALALTRPKIARAIVNHPDSPPFEKCSSAKVVKDFVKRVNAKYLLWALYDDGQKCYHWRLHGFEQGDDVLTPRLVTVINEETMVPQILRSITTDTYITAYDPDKKETPPWEMEHPKKLSDATDAEQKGENAPVLIRTYPTKD